MSALVHHHQQQPSVYGVGKQKLQAHQSPLRTVSKVTKYQEQTIQPNVVSRKSPSPPASVRSSSESKLPLINEDSQETSFIEHQSRVQQRQGEVVWPHIIRFEWDRNRNETDEEMYECVADQAALQAQEEAQKIFGGNERVAIIWIPEACWDEKLAPLMLMWEPEKYWEWKAAAGFVCPTGSIGTIPKSGSIIQDDMLECVKQQATVCIMAGVHMRYKNDRSLQKCWVSLLGWMTVPDIRLSNLPLYRRNTRTTLTSALEPFTRWKADIANFGQQPSLLCGLSDHDAANAASAAATKKDHNDAIPAAFRGMSASSGSSNTTSKNTISSFRHYYLWCDGRIPTDNVVFSVPFIQSRINWRLDKLVQQFVLLGQGSSWSVFDPYTIELLDHCTMRRTRSSPNTFVGLHSSVSHNFDTPQAMVQDRFVQAIICASVCHNNDWSLFIADAEAYAAALHYKTAVADPNEQTQLTVLNHTALDLNAATLSCVIVEGNWDEAMTQVLASSGQTLQESDAHMLCTLEGIERLIFLKVRSNVIRMIEEWREILCVDLEHEESKVLGHKDFRMDPLMCKLMTHVTHYMAYLTELMCRPKATNNNNNAE